MFSAKMENGPVTPNMVRGWMEKLENTGQHMLEKCAAG